MKEADLVDVDGFLVKRQIPVQAGAIWALMIKGLAAYDRQITVPEISRVVGPSGIRSLREALSFHLHSLRKSNVDVARRLNLRNTFKFGNTGRPNKHPWIELTWSQLEASSLMNVADIFLTPENCSTILSKAKAIASLQGDYDNLTHFDDDPRTVLILAKHFPTVQFVLFEDWSAKYLLKGVDWEQYKNVRRVEQVEEI